MIEPRTPENEAERQAAVERIGILDSLPERSYDDITALMSDVCDAPISLIGLIDRDRHWLKSHHGIDIDESPRSLSFCGHTIASDEPIFTVEDARIDPRFADNPVVTGYNVAGYAGVSLVDADGFALGALCVFSHEPMILKSSQKSALQNMARQVMYLLERHQNERRLEKAGRELTARNDELKRFAGAVTHDIRSPITNIVALADLIEEDSVDSLSGEVQAYLDHLKGSSIALRTYVEGLLAHYTSDDTASHPAERFRLEKLFVSLDQMIVRDARTTLVFPDVNDEIQTHKAALQQILLNLIANAIKYGTGSHTQVEVGFEEDTSGYRFKVVDDGPGIALERHESIFGLFDTGDSVARDGAEGTGIGLATVKRLLDRVGGAITLNSAPGKGSTFSFTLPRVAAPDAEALAN